MFFTEETCWGLAKVVDHTLQLATNPFVFNAIKVNVFCTQDVGMEKWQGSKCGREDGGMKGGMREEGGGTKRRRGGGGGGGGGGRIMSRVHTLI